ncbi:hypothetical protein EV178_006015 [Coemansia sp. RSA 1646]|nr:hypothetical protein EV178_006015 [Coemansia sp. RSA 1646]
MSPLASKSRQQQQQQQHSAFSSAASPAWSIFDIFSAPLIKKGKTFSKRTSPSSSAHSFSRDASPVSINSDVPSPLSSPETTPGLLQNKKLGDAVSRLVSQYMDLSDCHSQGFIDISTPPKRRTGGLLSYSRKPPPPCNLYYEVFGTGPKKLFMIMGMVGTTMYWRLQSRYFANHGEYTVCVFDNRGSGKSTIAPGPYKISQMAKDAYKLLDHLGWTENVHMVGISLGGMIAQEMCLLNEQADTLAASIEGKDVGPPRFASIALVDTWHSASLALPTVQEIRFSFKGMAAFGDDPKHLIKLVFSPGWIRSPFHDITTKHTASSDTCDDNGAADEDVIPTNKDVMGTLFRAIQKDLNMHREWTNETVAEKSQPPISRQSPASTDESPLSPLNTNVSRLGKLATRTVSNAVPVEDDMDRSNGDSRSQPTLHHSRSVTNAAAMSKKDTPPAPAQAKTAYNNKDTNTSGTKREAAGDIHQFIACMGHRLSPQRVRMMRTLNPRTRFLVIHGEKDKVIRPFCGRSLAKLLGCPIIWIKNAGHMPPIDAHCTFNLVLRAFTRNERWLRELPDRTCLSPSTWEEQAKTKEWIASNKNTDLSLNIKGTDNSESDDDSLANVRLSWLLNDNDEEVENKSQLASSINSLELQNSLSPQLRKRRISRVDHIHSVGPLSKGLLFVDEGDIDLAARVIPANIPSPQIGSSTRENTASSLQSLAEWLSPTTTAASVTASSSPPTLSHAHEMLAYGILLDAPFRIRRYSLSENAVLS